MDRFAYDYSVLSGYLDFSRMPTNLTECIKSDELFGLLSVCLDKDREQVCSMSDYEVYKAFCNSIPLLKGHPIVAKVETLLSNVLHSSISLEGADADALWLEGAEMLSRAQKNIGGLLADAQAPYLQRILCDASTLDTTVSMGVEPILDGNTLMHTRATNWTDWEGEMQSVLERFSLAGCRGVVLTIPEEYRHVLPDPYHVNQCLENRKDTSECNSMLLSQVLRYFIMTCQARGMFMILHLHCRKEEAMALLSRIQSSVKLPKILVTASDLVTAAEIMQLCLRQRMRSVSCAILTAEYPSDTELSTDLAYYAARYPLGCLQVITGDDFRYTKYQIQRAQ